MKRLGLAGRIGILAAMAAVMGHAPQEAQELFDARRRVPPDPKDPKATTRMQNKTAADIDVEVPQAAPGSVLATNHAMYAIIKVQKPTLNRKQRRQLVHRMQARATKARQS